MQTGIVHIGIGAFHRAHQAVYTDAVLAGGDLGWGIVGASLRSVDTRDALAPQDGLYTVAVRDGGGERLSVIGSSTGLLVVPENPQALLAAMTDPQVKIVSLTVTEKGYCHSPASGELDEAHPDIRHDLASPHLPRSAIGFIVEAIA
ncbi:MAG: mannitol dehydrogenase family protein, partial [Mesorhizobium sp.]